MGWDELITAPASKISKLSNSKNIHDSSDCACISSIHYVLDRWFESEPLKATLATDAVIGAMNSPKRTGSG